MLKRSALYAGEYSRVKQLAHHLHFTFRGGFSPRVFKVFSHKNNSATRSAQCFMGGRGYNVRIFQGIIEQSGGNKSGRMRHINHQQSPHVVGNLTHSLIVPFTTVGRASADNKFGFMLQSQPFHLFVIHSPGFFIEVVAYGFVKNARCVDQTTVRKVSAVSKIQAHKGVTGIETYEQNSFIGLRTRVGLNVGKLCPEELFHSFAC